MKIEVNMFHYFENNLWIMDFGEEVFLQIGCEKFEEFQSLGFFFSVFVRQEEKRKKLTDREDFNAVWRDV